MGELNFFSLLYNVPQWEKRMDSLLETFELQSIKNIKPASFLGPAHEAQPRKALLNSPCFCF